MERFVITAYVNIRMTKTFSIRSEWRFLFPRMTCRCCHLGEVKWHELSRKLVVFIFGLRMESSFVSLFTMGTAATSCVYVHDNHSTLMRSSLDLLGPFFGIPIAAL